MVEERIVAFHNSHNASVCEIKNKEIVYSQESERINNIKKSNNLSVLINKYKQQKVDKLIFLNHGQSVSHDIDCNNVEYIHKHHFFHACCAYFNSDFNKSYVLVLDGKGVNDEIVSLYYFNKNKYKIIFKVFTSINERKEGHRHYINTLSLGHLFKITAKILNMKESGSVMGLSSYQNVSGFKIFGEQFNHFKTDQNFIKYLINEPHNIEMKKSICSSVQQETEKIVISYVKNIIKNKKRNLCVSGGVFQNSVLNGKLLDHCDNLFVDPISHDGGLSIGAALWAINQDKYCKVHYKNLFLGDSLDYSSLVNARTTNVKQIAELLIENKIIAIMQGRNEIGPRALGNRSILFDPRDPEAKNKINELKQREWFRPYAGTVLYEYAHEWFDLKNKKETPYMSYCFKVKNNKVPGITHVDDTCRIQTLKREQNPYFYDLIKTFYSITEVPILFNTSFNEAGMPLINSIDQAVNFFNKNKYLDGIYFPEIQKLIIR